MKKQRKLSLSQMDFGAKGQKKIKLRSSPNKNSSSVIVVQSTVQKIINVISTLGESASSLLRTNKRVSNISSLEGGSEGRGKVGSARERGTPPGQDLLNLGSAPTPPRNLAVSPSSTKKQRKMAAQEKKQKGSDSESGDGLDEKEEPSEEDLDFISDNPRYVKKKMKEEKEKRLAAGEKLEDIKRDFAQRKKKMGVKRSPLPPGL